MPWPGRFAVLLFCAASTLLAQKVVSARAGLITYLQGPAFVDGRRVVLKSARFPQMENGETLSTGRGAAEVLLSPGVILRLSDNSELRMDQTQLDDTRVTLLRGDALLEVVRLIAGNQVQIRLGETIIEVVRAGVYRFGNSQTATDQPTLRVWGGEALVRSGEKTVDARRGMAVRLDPGLAASRFDRKQTDALHAWAARRSFELFRSDPDVREKQTNWQGSGSGYIENRDFGVVFRLYPRLRSPRPAFDLGSRAEQP